MQILSSSHQECSGFSLGSPNGASHNEESRDTDINKKDTDKDTSNSHEPNKNEQESQPKSGGSSSGI